MRLGGIGENLAKEIEKRTGKEARTTVLGHIQRGGTPTAFDRVLATRFGLQAIDAVQDGDFGKMVALQGTDIVRVGLDEATKELKTVPVSRYEEAGGLLRLRSPSELQSWSPTSRASLPELRPRSQGEPCQAFCKRPPLASGRAAARDSTPCTACALTRHQRRRKPYIIALGSRRGTYPSSVNHCGSWPMR
ncbi:6-phosphofructokinase [Streptosporangium vulgare]|uniref:6-phosphofructokinase n=1 Tax=Streptosporangium vulgare TaxID=46190 RepID=UPI0031DDDD63